MLMFSIIAIFPAQQPRPALAFGISNATDNLEWRRDPQDFRALLFSRSRDNLHRQTFFRIHREGIGSLGFCFTFYPLKNLARIDKAIRHFCYSPVTRFPLPPQCMRAPSLAATAAADYRLRPLADR